MYCLTKLFLLYVVPYPLIKVSNTCVDIREALDSVALAVPRGHNSYQVITVWKIVMRTNNSCYYDSLTSAII